MKPYLIAGGVVLVIAIGVVATLRLSGPEDTWICQNGTWVKHGNPTAEAPTGDCSGTTEVSGEQTMETVGESVVGSIKEAMGLGKTMRCSYAVMGSDGKTQQASVVVNGEKFKTVSAMNGTNITMVFDGTTQYTWTEGVPQGIKIARTCMDEIQASIPRSNASDASAQNVPQGPSSAQQSFENVVGASCTVADEEDFSVPTTVTFMDQCQMMKQSLEAMKKSQQSQGSQGAAMPKGVVTPAPAAYPQ